MVDECSSNPCQNGGNCTDRVDDFECACTEGYGGSLCDVDVDECASSPCQYGGTCRQGLNYYNCTCNDGTTGYNCESNIDDCQSNPCANSSTCVDGINKHDCLCAPGYTGDLCDNDIDECLSNPCLSGSCVNELARYTCQCNVGYTGMQCETEIRECQSNPCQNRGTCTDMVGEYLCLCSAGFTGDLCESNIDECQSGPCFNLAMCIDGVASFVCQCPNGFTGQQCETNEDNCLSMPCRHGGTCVDEVDGYRCTCRPGFTGQDCETNVNECAFFPCQNGGTCLDRLNGYKCNCQDGFTGLKCETELDECASTPCLNSGTCRDLVNSYRCDCPVGFTGDQCEYAVTAFHKFVACGLSSGIVALTTRSTYAFARATFNGMEIRTFPTDFDENVTGYVFAADVWQDQGNNGTIITVSTENPKQFSVFSEGAKDRLVLEFGNTTETFPLALPIDDGATHRFVMIVTDVWVAVFIDGKQTGRSQSGVQFSGRGSIELGGKNGEGDFIGFQGDVTVAESDVVTGNSSFAQCVVGCYTSSCVNGGVCIDDYNGKQHCVCPAGFTGDDCSVLSGTVDNSNTARFYGVSFLQVNNTLTKLANNVSLSVRTACDSGLIYYTRQLPADAVPAPMDYFAVRLVAGKVEFSFQPNSDGALTLTSAQAVNDNQWHRVQAVRENLRGTLVVDGQSTSGVAGGLFDSLDATGDVCIGGVPDESKVIGLTSSTGLNGCIRDLIEDGTPRDLEQHLSYRAVGFGHCQGPRSCD